MDKLSTNKENVFITLIKMAIPAIVSMLIQSLYNVIDSIFVAKISEDALTAVSLAFPLQNFSLAVSVGTGIAVNVCVAKNLGSGDADKVRSYIYHGFILTFLHSVLFLLIGIFAVPYFFRIFTDNELILQYAVQYSAIVISLTFGSLFHILIEKILQATGNMVVPMLMQGLGAVINIILDPILIFGVNGHMKYGIKGAAIATIIGQMASCLFAIIYFISLKSKNPAIILKKEKLDFYKIKILYSIGIPSGVLIALPSILVSALNKVLVQFGKSAIAFFGIYYKLQTLVYMPISGLIQGMRPLISYNLGKKDIERVYSIIKMSCLIAFIISAGFTVFFLFFPQQILNWFNAPLQLKQIGITGLRILAFGFLFSPIAITISGAFEALGKGYLSIIISLIRQFIIILAVSILFSRYLGINIIWVSFVISEIAAGIVSFYMLKQMTPKLNLLSKKSTNIEN